MSKEKIITANRGYFEYFSELWKSKELFWILAKRDILVKYKQTILGVGWSAARPLVTAIVMSFAFGKIGKLDQDASIPFSIIVMPGVIVWLFFSQSLLAISQSIILNSNLVTKVYFPRLIIPMSTIFLGLLDVAISILIFFAMCIFYSFMPDWKIIFIPIVILLTFLAVFGIGLMSAVLNVKFRDIGQLVPFVIQFGMFISPVAYLTSSVKAPWSKVFVLNPVTGAIDLMRWCLLGDYVTFNWSSFIPMLVFIIITFILSIRFFKKHENSFVDYI